MIEFCNIADHYRSIYYICLLLILVVNTGVLVFSLHRMAAMKRNPLYTVFTIITDLMSYVFLQRAALWERLSEEYRAENNSIRILVHLPAIFWFAFLIWAMVATFLSLYDMVVWWKSHLSSKSIKESMDALPVGVSYYDEDGRTYLLNNTMNDISIVLRGKIFRNANEFYNDIIENSIIPPERLLKLKDDVLVVDSGDGIFAFRESKLSDSRGSFKELKVTDVTVEYNKLRELNDKRQQLRGQRKRLRDLGKSITQTTIKKERLEAKIRVHDRLGECLIAARRYLKAGEGDRDAITTLWLNNLELAAKASEEKTEDDILTPIFDAADDIGINIVMNGDEVHGNDRRILADALHECITNTIRHAHGDTVYVDIKDGGKLMTFTNNGDAPESKIDERGGLLNLRQTASVQGYKMMISSTPVFKLMLRKEETQDALFSDDR